MSYAKANDGYYSSNKSNYSFSLMNNEFGITSLMRATLEGDYKASSIFISSGNDINAKNTAGCTALHLASRKGYSNIVKLLVDNGANVNVKDNDGWTPLMRASVVGDAESVKILVNNGAKVWYLNKWNESALVHSALSNCIKCADIIIKNTNLSEIENRKPLKKQNKEAKDIIIKKYNKDFEKLLNDFEEELYKIYTPKELLDIEVLLKPEVKTSEVIAINKEAVEKSKKKCGFFKKIVYIFTGKKVTAEELKTDKKTKKIEDKKDIIKSQDNVKKKKSSETKEKESIKEINLNNNKIKHVEPRKKPTKEKSPKTKKYKQIEKKEESINKKKNAIKEIDLNVPTSPKDNKNRHRKIIPREKEEIEEISLNEEKYKTSYKKQKLNTISSDSRFGSIRPKTKIFANNL